MGRWVLILTLSGLLLVLLIPNSHRVNTMTVGLDIYDLVYHLSWYLAVVVPLGLLLLIWKPTTPGREQKPGG